MPTHTFQEVSIKGTKRWTDTTGKKRQMTRKFYQTINPFNTNSKGVVKTREEILQELVDQRQDWLTQQGFPA